MDVSTAASDLYAGSIDGQVHKVMDNIDTCIFLSVLLNISVIIWKILFILNVEIIFLMLSFLCIRYKSILFKIFHIFKMLNSNDLN